jgi:nicotinamide-nucleotide amidase
MNHVAEIVSVGTELLLGNTTNTDARDISIMLSEIGINVYYHTVVGDNPTRLKAAVDIAKSRADIIITTGGLGPTFDDLTKQTLAEAFGVKLIFSEEEAERIRSYFERRLHNIEMTGEQSQQAYLPKTAPCSTMSGARLPAVPLWPTTPRSSCYPARPESASPCSNTAPYPTSRP